MTEETDVYPDKVLGSRVIIQGGNEVQQTLIQWKNKALEDVTWEDNEVLCCCVVKLDFGLDMVDT